MNLRQTLPDDLKACVNLLMETYNPPPWNNHWTQDTGKIQPCRMEFMVTLLPKSINE